MLQSKYFSELLKPFLVYPTYPSVFSLWTLKKSIFSVVCLLRVFLIYSSLHCSHRFGNVEICLCWVGGSSWSYSGFHSYYLVLIIELSPLFAYSLLTVCVILQSAKNLYESILGVSTNSLAQIQVRTFRTLDC